MKKPTPKKTPKAHKPALVTMRGPNDIDKLNDSIVTLAGQAIEHNLQIQEASNKAEQAKKMALTLENDIGTRVDALEDLITLVRSEKSLDEVRRTGSAQDKQIGKLERTTEKQAEQIAEHARTVGHLIEVCEKQAERLSALEKFVDPKEEHIYGNQAGAELDVDINTVIANFIRDNMRFEIEVD